MNGVCGENVSRNQSLFSVGHSDIEHYYSQEYVTLIRTARCTHKTIDGYDMTFMVML